MGTKLTVRQKILMAAMALEAEMETFSVEELIMKSWELFPESFSLRGYHAKHPCSNRVLSKLSGSDGLCGLGWLEHTDQRMYKMTRKGRVLARQLSAIIAEGGVKALATPVQNNDATTPPTPPVPSVSSETHHKKPRARRRKSRGAMNGTCTSSNGVVTTPRTELETDMEPSTVEAIPLTPQDAHAINLIAKSDALGKFLRGSPLSFMEASGFWGISATMPPANIDERLREVEALLKLAVDSFGSKGTGDDRIPPLSTCYGLLNLHKLMLGKFCRELDKLRTPQEAVSPAK